jgi:catechol 2,3-dioxygenase-like lactoylglutathione lyase family enzyme
MRVKGRNQMATVRYLVRDVDEALSFYAALSFELVNRMGPPFAVVRRGDLTLWLSGPGSSAARPLHSGAQPAPGGWCRFVVEVADLAACVKALHAAGAASPRSAPVEGPGGLHLVLDDPSGNPVEIFQAAVPDAA